MRGKIVVVTTGPTPSIDTVWNGVGCHRVIDGTCKITLNGVEATVGDLKIGDYVEVDGQPAVRITATRS